MTDNELSSVMRDRSMTYPRWMDRADAVSTWEFKRLVAKATKLKRPKGRSWRASAEALLMDFAALEHRVTRASLRRAP